MGDFMSDGSLSAWERMFWASWADFPAFRMRDELFTSDWRVRQFCVVRKDSLGMGHFAYPVWRRRHWWQIVPFHVRRARGYAEGDRHRVWCASREEAMETAIAFGNTGKFPKDQRTDAEKLQDEVNALLAVEDLIR